jgi:hypothetical protein
MRLGKRAAVATDEVNAGVMRACLAAAGLGPDVASGHSEGGEDAAAGGSGGGVALEVFPPGAAWTDATRARLAALAERYDHAVAIERAGRAEDGHYYTMRALDM